MAPLVAHFSHGAGTGRWAARGAQLQNLMRPTESASAVSQIIDMILEGEL